MIARLQNTGVYDEAGNFIGYVYMAEQRDDPGINNTTYSTVYITLRVLNGHLDEALYTDCIKSHIEFKPREIPTERAIKV